MTQRFAAALFALFAFAAGMRAHAAIPTRAQIHVTGYVIHVDLDPATGRLSAKATVTFTALDDLTVAVFGLNNGLQLTSVTPGVAAISAPAPAPGPVLRGRTAAPPPPPPAPDPAPAVPATLTFERNVTDSTIRVTPAAILTKGTSVTWTFTYAGLPSVQSMASNSYRSPIPSAYCSTPAAGFLSRCRDCLQTASPPRCMSP